MEEGNKEAEYLNAGLDRLSADLKQTKEININLKLNKTRAIIAGIVIGSLLLLTGAYVLGAKSKDGQIKACHEVLESIDDALNDYTINSSEARDNLKKCDPSYK